jgi:hypothetical protein
MQRRQSWALKSFGKWPATPPPPPHTHILPALLPGHARTLRPVKLKTKHKTAGEKTRPQIVEQKFN